MPILRCQYCDTFEPNSNKRPSMAQLESIDVKCPLCNTKFAVPRSAAGSRVACPHCSGQVKIAGTAPVTNDDDAWLRLDHDLPAPLAKQSKPDAIDAAGFGNFDLPDLPPVASVSFPQVPGSKPTSLPPLSEADLDALSGLANDNDQQSAPVKTVRQPDLLPTDSFRLKCPTCESMTYAKMAQVGKKIRCNDCHSTFTVPPPPKAKVKYEPDMESAKAYAFQDSGDGNDFKRPADPFQKSAADYLRDAEKYVDSKPDDDWTVPSIGDWFIGVFGIFRDVSVIGYWAFLTAIAAIPAAIALQYSSTVLVMVMFGGGLVYTGLLVVHGFAIMQSVANEEERVTEWPVVDFWAWIGPLFVAAAALAVAAGPIWMLGQHFFGLSLMTTSMAMASLYLLYPFVLLSMLSEQSVLVPFSVEVSKSVTRSSEQWGVLYLSAGIVFFALFMIYMVAFTALPVVTTTLAIAATVAAVFIYFGLIGRLAFSIGHAINAPPMVNDLDRKRPNAPQPQSGK